MSGLSAQQLEQYNTDGYVMVPDVFDVSDLEPLRQELTDVIHNASLKLHAEGQLSQLYDEEPFETRLIRLYSECPDILKAITGAGGGGHSGPAFFDLITSAPILSRIESLVGAEIVGSSVYRIRPKVPGMAGGAVPWHQDSGYFNPFCDDKLIVTCWIPLVDTTPENGCLRVLPSSHRQGVTRHFRDGPGGYLWITEEDLPTVEALTVPVPAGGVLFMTNCTPHMSTAHQVDIVRWAIDVRYQSADLPNNIDILPEAYDPSAPDHEVACYPPEADFVIQSRRDPVSVVSTWEQFYTIRQRYQSNRPTYRGRGWSSTKEQLAAKKGV